MPCRKFPFLFPSGAPPRARASGTRDSHSPAAGDPLKASHCAGAAELLLLLSAFAPQLTSLRATLPASRPPRRTSFHAACAPLLTPLCASYRGRLLRLGLSICDR